MNRRDAIKAFGAVVAALSMPGAAQAMARGEGALKVEVLLTNLDQFRAEAESLAALVRRVQLLPAASLPPISDRLLDLFDVLADGPVTLSGEREPKRALGAGKLGVRVDFAPRVLEVVAAIRAFDVEVE